VEAHFNIAPDVTMPFNVEFTNTRTGEKFSVNSAAKGVRKIERKYKKKKIKSKLQQQGILFESKREITDIILILNLFYF
jgi:hypothetical protein